MKFCGSPYMLMTTKHNFVLKKCQYLYLANSSKKILINYFKYSVHWQWSDPFKYFAFQNVYNPKAFIFGEDFKKDSIKIVHTEA